MAAPAVRRAEPDDADALGAIHVASWRAAYPGLMPQAYLDGLDAGDRAARWRDTLEVPPRDPRTVRLVAELDGEVAGFAVAGAASGDETDEVGEVYTLNVDPAAWGSGAGRALLAACEEHLAAQGFTEAVVWLHPDNARSRAFYEQQGWGADGGTRRDEVFDVEIDEVRYRRALPPPPAYGTS